MKLTEINIYPVKSMGCISLKEATALPAGLKYDRRWLLLEEDGNFMTQRNFPDMAKVKFEWKENGFEARFLGSDIEPILIPFDEYQKSKIVAQVWDDEVSAFPMQKNIDEWFSELFNKKCSLVRIEENAVRKNIKGYPGKISSFADITPFLIIGEASLEDLNSRMDTPIPMTRFRSNFVFSGGAAFVEDDWETFKIGNIKFKRYKKCGRCKVTTIDQDTGIRMNDEPLATLSKYRKEDRNLNFGLRAFLADGQKAGVIKLGDEIT